MHQSCIDGLRVRYACGERVRDALRREIGNAPVTCNPVDIDRYRRLVARCYAHGKDLNRWMVASGWAVAYREFSRDYVPDEEHAKAMRLGMWSGEFELPSLWRARDRTRPH
jgi:endonuclease YncB( thermonuclease family)